MKCIETLNDLRKRLVADIRETVKKNGVKMRKGYALFTYEFCTETGATLDSSTIDAIRVYDDTLEFVYDMNDECSYDSVNEFTIEELAKFYDDLVEWLDNNND